MAVRRWARLLPVNAALALAALAALAPLAWMVSASLMAKGEATQLPAPVFPAHPTFFQYRSLFKDYALGRPLVNSLIVAALATIVTLAVTVPAGYAFAKLRFAGRDRAFRALLAMLVVPGQVAMLPLFLLLKEVGLVNSFAGAVAPWFAGIFGTVLVRQAALGIPPEMLDAARLDGASELQIFRLVAVPLLRPIIGSLAVLTFLGSWNDFLWPLIVLGDDRLYTLPVALAALSREHVQEAELMMAAAVVTTAPVLLLFLSLQRFYISGLLGGSVKG